jgi:23S rRNA (adenine2503-C2)-methyltransferase
LPAARPSFLFQITEQPRREVIDAVSPLDLGPKSTIYYNGTKINSTTMLRSEANMSTRGVQDHEILSDSVSSASSDEDLLSPVPRTESRPLLSASVDELREWITGRGHPAYRTRQVVDWVMRRRATAFEQMTNLPKLLRRQLQTEWEVFSTRIVYRGVSHDGTEKLLLGCSDGRRIECVLMSDNSRRTVCLSSQVGCAMGCVFCASGLEGVQRNLRTHEIVEQVLHLRNLLPFNETITHMVVMGMGESLANLDNLIAALDRLCSARDGLGISQRRVTISTVGLPAKILELAALNRRYHLAVSLHAPTESLRSHLVPVNKKIGLGAVLDAADTYFEQTGRQVTYEYTILRHVNDWAADATALAQILAARHAHVNLIPYNPVAGLPFARPDAEAVRRFVSILRDSAVSVTVRRTKGHDIEAACGQLRHRLQDLIER